MFRFQESLLNNWLIDLERRKRLPDFLLLPFLVFSLERRFYSKMAKSWGMPLQLHLINTGLMAWKILELTHPEKREELLKVTFAGFLHDLGKGHEKWQESLEVAKLERHSPTPEDISEALLSLSKVISDLKEEAEIYELSPELVNELARLLLDWSKEKGGPIYRIASSVHGEALYRSPAFGEASLIKVLRVCDVLASFANPEEVEGISLEDVFFFYISVNIETPNITQLSNLLRSLDDELVQCGLTPLLYFRNGAIYCCRESKRDEILEQIKKVKAKDILDKVLPSFGRFIRGGIYFGKPREVIREPITTGQIKSSFEHTWFCERFIRRMCNSFYNQKADIEKGYEGFTKKDFPLNLKQETDRALLALSFFIRYTTFVAKNEWIALDCSTINSLFSNLNIQLDTKTRLRTTKWEKGRSYQQEYSKVIEDAVILDNVKVGEIVKKLASIIDKDISDLFKKFSQEINIDIEVFKSKSLSELDAGLICKIAGLILQELFLTSFRQTISKAHSNFLAVAIKSNMPLNLGHFSSLIQICPYCGQSVSPEELDTTGDQKYTPRVRAISGRIKEVRGTLKACPVCQTELSYGVLAELWRSARFLMVLYPFPSAVPAFSSQIISILKREFGESRGRWPILRTEAIKRFLEPFKKGQPLHDLLHEQIISKVKLFLDTRIKVGDYLGFFCLICTPPRKREREGSDYDTLLMYLPVATLLSILTGFRVEFVRGGAYTLIPLSVVETHDLRVSSVKTVQNLMRFFVTFSFLMLLAFRVGAFPSELWSKARDSHFPAATLLMIARRRSTRPEAFEPDVLSWSVAREALLIS